MARLYVFEICLKPRFNRAEALTEAYDKVFYVISEVFYNNFLRNDKDLETFICSLYNLLKAIALRIALLFNPLIDEIILIESLMTPSMSINSHPIAADLFKHLFYLQLLALSLEKEGLTMTSSSYSVRGLLTRKIFLYLRVIFSISGQNPSSDL